MKKIQMVDVVAQYNKYESAINKRISAVLQSGSYIQGPEVKNFELLLSKYLDVEHVISCANGTDALCLALMSLDLQPGDEVIVPTFTFVSTVEAVCLSGFKPIFVDVDPDTFLLNPQLIKDAISNKTKAIIPVHLFGQCCDMEQLVLIAKKHDLFIIEDAAQSIGSKCNFKHKSVKNQFSGTIGDIGITSFYPSKNLGCFGDGGAIFTSNNQLADKIRLLANHGQTKKYTHDIIGLNSRLDSLQATILSFKLDLLDDFNAERKKVANYYNNVFSELDWIQTPIRTNHSDHIYHQYSILLAPKINRDEFQSYLLQQGIPTMIYYPTPLHKQKAYARYFQKPLPISEEISQHIISLPMHPNMEIEQLEFINHVIQKYI